MKHPVIAVENLGKEYVIGQAKLPHSLRDSLGEFLAAPWKAWRRRGQAGRNESDHFWALRNVNFSVQAGEVVGVIGRNGAGKSTLLKILSRITEPTEGLVRLRGRVASLLEVGTGFHVELTGRENIYLNGSILGMPRREIDRKFDEIVAFSEIEKFLDTPVKRYSSGMYVRLAFAVAAHLEPETLIVDEVLAVGDVAFQKKCLGKMQEVAGQGRTVLFVSHDMNTVTRLCPRAILLNQGRVIADGPAPDVTQMYLHSDHGTIAERSWPDPRMAPGDSVARLHSARVHTAEGQTLAIHDIRYPIGFEMTFEVFEAGHVLVPYFHVYNEEGICLFVANASNDPAWFRRECSPGTYTCTAWIPGNFLAEGTMIVSPALVSPFKFEPHFLARDAVAFQVVDSLDGDSVRGDYAWQYPGVVRPQLRWETRPHDPGGVPVAGHGMA